MGILERMKDRAEKTRQELDQERAKERRIKEDREREQVNERATFHKVDHAYCSVCDRDYKVLLRKHGNERLAYYLGQCSKGHTVRREITLRDRYYDVSPYVRRQREEHADDLLTPDHPRFRLVYPDKWRELERIREERERTTPTL